MSYLTENEVDARQEAERDLDAAEQEIRYPQCGEGACSLTRQFGRGEHADWECDCGWRFRADRSGHVLREFGYAA